MPEKQLASSIWETAVEHYTVSKKRLGEGGSGIVFAATDSGGQACAIKALSLEKATDGRRKRFQNELQFSLNNTHPNIIKVKDYGVSPGGAPFFVMPLFPATLRAAIARKITPDVADRLFAGILDGIEAAHKLGVWHRDLKPENILIDPAGVAVVADFGIAHFEQEELYEAVETKNNERLANFQYAAPEQRVRQRKIDHRADIYALGLILNEIFTGELAVGSKPKPIASVAPDRSYLDELVDEMIRQSPDDRPATVERVKERLIANRQHFVARQELDRVTKRVVKVEDVVDPLIADPVRIVTTDYRSGDLIFRLNQSVTPNWGAALREVGGPYTMGENPGMVRLSGTEARMQVGPGRETAALGFVKQWIETANRIYAEHVKEESAKREREHRARLEAERQQAEYRAQILKQLNT